MKASRTVLTLFLTCCGLSVAAAQAADRITAGPFSVDVSKRLRVVYNGRVLFSGDRCVAFKGATRNAPALLDTTQGEVLRSGNAVTLLQRGEARYFRREVFVTPASVQISFEIRAFGTLPSKLIQYDLITPAETLEGSRFKATLGDARAAPRVSRGIFEPATIPPLKQTLQQCRYIEVESASGAVTLDFNPDGPWRSAGTAYGYNACARLYRCDGEYRWMMLRAYAQEGNTFSGKVVVRPGAKPYEDIHPVTHVSYTTDFPMPLAVNFSGTESNARFVACAPGIKSDLGCRWITPVRIVEREVGGFLYHDFAVAADDAEDGIFEMEQRDGLYILTLNVHDATEATGPFSITGPDGDLFTDVTLKPGEYWIRSTPLRFRGGKAQLRFSGKWKINALSLKTLLYATEDFLVYRPFWNMAVPGSSSPMPEN